MEIGWTIVFKYIRLQYENRKNITERQNGQITWKKINKTR